MPSSVGVGLYLRATERLFPKQVVVGSNPIARFGFLCVKSHLAYHYPTSMVAGISNIYEETLNDPVSLIDQLTLVKWSDDDGLGGVANSQRTEANEAVTPKAQRIAV